MADATCQHWDSGSHTDCHLCLLTQFTSLLAVVDPSHVLWIRSTKPEICFSCSDASYGNAIRQMFAGCVWLPAMLHQALQGRHTPAITKQKLAADARWCLVTMQAFEKASGKKVAYKLAPRRGGDTEAVWAATETAEKELGWKTKLDIHDMCRDQWKWASSNPKGYEG